MEVNSNNSKVSDDAGSQDPQVVANGNNAFPVLLPDALQRSTMGDDDDDNWSRLVELDEATTHGYIQEDSFRMESVNEHHGQILEGLREATATNMTLHQLSIGSSTSGGIDLRMNGLPQPPAKPELSMKEKLVLRERQRRIETERARLKRQFALSGTSDANNEDSDDNDRLSEVGLNTTRDTALYDNRTAGSHAGIEGSITEGAFEEESTRGHADQEHDETADLGFNMERFLRNSETFNPMVESMDEAKENQGVVMERFLNGQLVVLAPLFHNDSSQIENNRIISTASVDESVVAENRPVYVGQRSVSFDVAATSTEPMASFGYDIGTNASLVSSNSAQGDAVEIDSVNVDDEIAAHSLMSPSLYGHDVTSNASDGVSIDEPRVLQLTEADMQELAAIEEASIGNAPPSEREEELSEIGELADFAGHNVLATDNTAMSQDTPTTAMESVSLISDGIGYQGSRMATYSHPRPVSTSSMIDANDDASTTQRSVDHLPIESIPPQVLLSPGAISNHSVAVNPPASVLAEEEDHTAELALEGTDMEPEQISRQGIQVVAPELNLGETIELRNIEAEAMSDRLRRSGFSPLDNPIRPLLGFQNTASNPRVNHLEQMNYGSIDNGYRHIAVSSYSDFRESDKSESLHLLVGRIPYEVNTDIGLRQNSDLRNSMVRSDSASSRRYPSLIAWDGKKRRVSVSSEAAEAVFHDIGSLAGDEEVHCDSKIYLKSNMFKRAFPERQIALLVTLVLELPVLFVITGRGESVCDLLGRKKFNLLIGLLPLTSAISGNVGLQASTLTTRAISHAHVTPITYFSWFQDEIGAALCLGCGMGFTLGSIAFVASGYDIPFAMTMFVAQLISIMTAGITGTLAPIIFTFIFRRDSGKWSGPLETAIQDIVGSVAMMVISYHFLIMFGQRNIDPLDTCSGS